MEAVDNSDDIRLLSSLISGRNLVEAMDNSDDICLLSKFDFWTKSWSSRGE